MRLNVNGTVLDVPDHWHDEPLLFTLREHLGLMGTKYGCGIGMCGACKVHIDGEVVNSCLVLTGDVAGGNVLTIEGLAQDGQLRPVQRAWIEERVPQCGYCQAGMIMQAEKLLSDKANPSDREIETAFAGNLCRCGTYDRIKKAVRRAAQAETREIGTANANG